MRRILLTLLIVLIALPTTAVYAQPAAVSQPVEPSQHAAQQIASYAIAVRLNVDPRTLDGTETITYLNTTTKPIPDLVFHLYLNAFRDENSIFMKESGPQHRGFGFDPKNNGWIEVKNINLADGTPLNLALLEDGTLARAVLPKAVAPGEMVKLEVKFTAKLPKVFARTGWALDASGKPFFMVGQWFPKLGVWTEKGWNSYPFHANSEFFSDFGTYEVQITLPDGYITAGTGMPAGQSSNGDGTQTVKYHAKNVIDFAWMASPNAKDAIRKVGSVEIRYVYLPEHAWTVDQALDAAEHSVTDFGKWYGPYPYPRLTVVDVPDKGEGAGGMEYPTLVTAGAMDLIGIGTGPIRTGWERAVEMVTVHEIGHQWWQSMVAFNEAEEPWLDEGITDYSTARLMNIEYGANSSAIDVGDFEATYLDTRRMSYLQNPNVPMYGKAWDFTGMDYGVAAYAKPALSLLTLERVLGKETMLKVMSTFFQRYQYAHPTTEDFRKVAEETSGQDLSWFFDALVYGKGVVNYVANGINGRTITITHEGALAVPVDIQVTFTDGTSQTITWDGKDPHQHIFNFDKPVQAFTIDPQHKVLVERIYSDNGRTLRADLPAWLTVVTRLVYHLQDWLLILGGI